MSIIAWIILGATAGWLASIVVRTNEHQGLFLNVLVGIIGAIAGGAFFQLLGASTVTGINFYSLIVATLGAVVLLLLVRSVNVGHH